MVSVNFGIHGVNGALKHHFHCIGKWVGERLQQGELAFQSPASFILESGNFYLSVFLFSFTFIKFYARQCCKFCVLSHTSTWYLQLYLYLPREFLLRKRASMLYFANVFFIYSFTHFLWPPYSPALVNGSLRKFYTWWTLSVISNVTTWIFSWSSLNYRVGQKVTKFGVFSDPTRKLSALTPERGSIL